MYEEVERYSKRNNTSHPFAAHVGRQFLLTFCLSDKSSS